MFGLSGFSGFRVQKRRLWGLRFGNPLFFVALYVSKGCAWVSVSVGPGVRVKSSGLVLRFKFFYSISIITSPAE